MKFSKPYSVAFIIATAAILISCSNTAIKNKESTDILASHQLIFDKLIGTWENKNGKDFERWSKNNDGSYHSLGFRINGSDTSWDRDAKIYPENDKWVFENLGRNDTKSVKFISIILNDKTVQFSNPSNNFPSDVNYTIADSNTLNAFIVGHLNDHKKMDTISYNYTK